MNAEVRMTDAMDETMAGPNEAYSPEETFDVVCVGSYSETLMSEDGVCFRRCDYHDGKKSVEVFLRDHMDTSLVTLEDEGSVALFNELESVTQLYQGCVTELQDIGRTFQIARSLLKEALRNEARLMAPNEYRRKIHSVAQKVGATPEEVEPLLTSILEELFAEMTKPQPKANTRRKHR